MEREEEDDEEEEEVNPNMKCVDASGAAVWCSSIDAVVPDEEEELKQAEQELEKVVREDEDEAEEEEVVNPNMKCVDASGAAVWCSSIDAVGPREAEGNGEVKREVRGEKRQARPLP